MSTLVGLVSLFNLRLIDPARRNPGNGIYMEKKETRGGARLGAGRKGEGKVLITATISRERADRLKKEDNKSATVDEALRKHYLEIDAKNTK